MVKLGVTNERSSPPDADDIVAAEIADGYVETDLGFVEETINLRKLPGEGEFDLAGFVDAVEQTGFDGAWGHEILSEEYRRLSMDDAYRRAYDTAMTVLD
jgi:sugar phosphate isomerase/epimerase